MPRRKLIAGNWKMNGLRADGLALVRALVQRAGAEGLVADVVICPPATLLTAAAEALAGSGIGLGAQDCHSRSAGAHTGDLSAAMLRDAGCGHVILGHSERRTDHHESDAQVRAKAKAAHDQGLVVILCVGETAQQRDDGRALEVVARQLAGSLPPGLAAAGLAIAYEPVWAIGTGRTPGVGEIAEVHAHIRAELRARVDDPAALRVLYGGSVKSGNARELLQLPEVDGALVGGASLAADDFWAIVRSAA